MTKTLTALAFFALGMLLMGAWDLPALSVIGLVLFAAACLAGWARALWVCGQVSKKLDDAEEYAREYRSERNTALQNASVLRADLAALRAASEPKRPGAMGCKISHAVIDRTGDAVWACAEMPLCGWCVPRVDGKRKPTHRRAEHERMLAARERTP